MKKQVQQPGRARNILHDHPMLKKGGVHDKTNKAKRVSEKQELKKKLDKELF